MKIVKYLPKFLIISLSYLLTFLVIVGALTFHPRIIKNWEYFKPLLFILFLPLLFKYSLHLFILLWHGIVNRKNTKKNHCFRPRVSFIVPAWNEQVGIIPTIDSILRSSYDNFELIIVNDGSTDNTDSVIRDYVNDYKGSVLIRYFQKDNEGKSSALNLGVKEATGEIIMTTDADCVVDSNAINCLVKQFSQKDIMAVAGNTRVGNSFKIISSIQKLEYAYGFYFKRADSLLNSVYIVGGAAAAYRKEVFSKLGFFDTEIITEDIEYSTRILNAGYKIRYAADAIFYTEAPSDLTSLIKQRLRWKYGRLVTFAKYRSLFFRFGGKQSVFLSFVILPVALLAEILLLLEILSLPLFYYYTFAARDFTPLAYTVIALSLIIFLQILFDFKKKDNIKILVWVPVAWLTFYFIDFVEYVALANCIVRIIKNKKVSWQKWERLGVFGSETFASKT